MRSKHFHTQHFTTSLLKKTSVESDMFRHPRFYVSTLIYATMCIGWVFALRHIKLANAGAIHNVVMVVLLALIGIVIFKETLFVQEHAEPGCAISALIMLGGPVSL